MSVRGSRNGEIPVYPGRLEEGLSVIGTQAFMDFVESIQAEGVTLERTPMGPGGGGNTLLAIEVDRDLSLIHI